MDAALLIAAGFLVIFLNLWLIPKRQGFQKRYAQRGLVIGAVLVVVGLVMATG